MNIPFKRFLGIGGVLAGVGATIWALRDRLLPAPQIPEGPPPRFRTAAAPSAPIPAGDDDLTDIKGIGPVYAGRLADAGVTTFAELAAADAATLAPRIHVPEPSVADWIEQAARRT